MVQTRGGVKHNPWVTYMKACAENYRAGKPQQPAAADEQKTKRRLTGKQPAAATGEALKPMLMKNKPKAKAKPITKKDEQALQKTVTTAKKQKEKEKAKEKKSS